jgi:hypothetical protein
VIREHHLITKIPHYFDEPNRSAPQLSQSGRPVHSSAPKGMTIHFARWRYRELIAFTSRKSALSDPMLEHSLSNHRWKG